LLFLSDDFAPHPFRLFSYVCTLFSLRIILLYRPHDDYSWFPPFFYHPFFLLQQHGRSDSYRVATLPNIRDDNKTADGMYKVLRRGLYRPREFSTLFYSLINTSGIWYASSSRPKSVEGSLSLSVLLSAYSFLLSLPFVVHSSCADHLMVSSW
jgi:hypothetical protein